VTDRAPTIVRAHAAQSSKSQNGDRAKQSDAAHKNSNLLAMWNKFLAVCECVPLNPLSESAEMFAGFEPVADGVT
jgi:hypothetical protein